MGQPLSELAELERKLMGKLTAWQREFQLWRAEHERLHGHEAEVERVRWQSVEKQLAAQASTLDRIDRRQEAAARVDTETLKQLGSVRVEAREAKLNAAQTAGVGAGGGALVAVIVEVARGLLGW